MLKRRFAELSMQIGHENVTDAPNKQTPPETPPLAYVGIEVVWAFRTMRRTRKAMTADAKAAMRAATDVSALPSALDPYSIFNGDGPEVDERAVERLASLGRRHRDSWIRFTHPDGRDARAMTEAEFAKEHTMVTGHPLRYARVVGPVRHVGCGRDGQFRCGGEHIEDIVGAMRGCGVSIEDDTMHVLGDPISLQSIALDLAAGRPGACHATIGELRHHVDTMRNLENGASSRGIATDLQIYDSIAGTAPAENWTKGVALLLKAARKTWSQVIASDATVAICRAIDAPVSIFRRIGRDSVEDVEAREDYVRVVEALCDLDDANELEQAHDLVHLTIDADDPGEANLRFALGKFLTSSTRTVACGHEVGAAVARIHETATSRIMVIERTSGPTYCCWSRRSDGGHATSTFH